jgi:hypothetical protein
MKFHVKGFRYRWSPIKFCFNLFFVLIVLLIGLAYFTNQTNASIDSFQIKIIIEDGDTLWSIAERYAGQSDPRKIAEMIRKTNNMHESNLKIGQELTLVFESI